VVDLTDAASFGRRVWAEAAQRGVVTADEVVIIGDGAHWIWNLAETYFPDAVQILDWYHASSYLWNAAYAIYGDGSGLAQAWAQAQLERLWQGEVPAVLAHLQVHSSLGGAVTDAMTYYTNHQARMDYPRYRAQGLHMGSGSIESGCKHVLAARLKQAGMMWTHDGALAVATVRAWLKSGRWAEAMQVRPRQRRRYRRHADQALPAVPPTAPPPRAVPTARAAQPPAAPAVAPHGSTRPAPNHPWRQAWSGRQQRQDAHARRPRPPEHSSG
jgi:hypothetical protein